MKKVQLFLSYFVVMADQFSGLDTRANHTRKIVHTCDLQHACCFAHEKDSVLYNTVLSIRKTCAERFRLATLSRPLFCHHCPNVKTKLQDEQGKGKAVLIIVSLAGI